MLITDRPTRHLTILDRLRGVRRPPGGNYGDHRTSGLDRSALLAHDILELGDCSIPLRKLVRSQEGNHPLANRTVICGYLGDDLFSGYGWVLLFISMYF